MNSFELGGCFGLFGGAALGSLGGYARLGPLGALGGGLLGALGGVFLGTGAVVGAYGLGVAYERAVQRRALRRHFGAFWSRGDAWAALKDRLTAGASYSGRVVWTRSSGAFLDLGEGFPALLKTVDGGVLGPVPSSGETASATLLSFDDVERVIQLTRKARAWLVFEGVRVAWLLGEPAVREGQAFTCAVTNSTQRRFAQRLMAGEALLASITGVGAVRVSQPEGRDGTGALTISKVELRPADAEVEGPRGDPP